MICQSVNTQHAQELHIVVTFQIAGFARFIVIGGFVHDNL